jgi:hypothetical protein
MFVSKLPSLDIDFQDLPDKVKPYAYPKLTHLNDDLNRLNTFIWDSLIPKTPQGSKVFERATSRLSPYMSVRGKMVGTAFYGAENITNAWLKMRELLVRFPPKPHRQGHFRSYHMAEAPGAFISSLQTYMNLDLKLEDYDWDWRAQSLSVDFAPHALKDSFGLMKNHPDNWILVGSGDITDAEVVQTTSISAVEELGSKVQIFTSDPKGPVKDYSKEAESQYPLFLGTMVGMIESITTGGIAYIKVFSLSSAYAVNLLAVLATLFKNVYITKPLTSKPANSERYIVGQDYLGFTKSVKAIYNTLYWQLYHKETGRVFIPSNLIPSRFITAVRKAEEELTGRQVRLLNEVVRSMINETYREPISRVEEIVGWVETNMPPKTIKKLEEILLHEIRMKVMGIAPKALPEIPKRREKEGKVTIKTKRAFEREHKCDPEILSPWICGNLYKRYYIPIMDGKKNVTEDFVNEYLDTVANTTEWATSFEVSSVPNVYEVNLEVWEAGEAPDAQPQGLTSKGKEIYRSNLFEYSDDAETIRVLYLGQAHYNALLETDEEDVFREMRVIGDGNCFYRSVGLQVYEDGSRHHRQVREDISIFLRGNPEKISLVLPRISE